jgi:hypothetical protein
LWPGRAVNVLIGVDRSGQEQDYSSVASSVEAVKTAEDTVMMMKVLELRNFKKAGGVVPDPKSQANMSSTFPDVP